LIFEILSYSVKHVVKVANSAWNYTVNGTGGKGAVILSRKEIEEAVVFSVVIRWH
jgi:hypothetical protein